MFDVGTYLDCPYGKGEGMMAESIQMEPDSIAAANDGLVNGDPSIIVVGHRSPSGDREKETENVS